MSLTKLDLEVLRRFFRLPEGKAFVAVLETKLEAIDVKLRRASGEELYRAQGHAQALEALIREITGAEQNLNRQPQIQPSRAHHPFADETLN